MQPSRQRLRSLIGALFGAVASLIVLTVARAEPYAWVQLGEGGRAQIRVVSTSRACPRLLIDGRAEPMQLRAGPDTAFPVSVCQANAPAHAHHAAVQGTELKLPEALPRRIVVIGDTGCRLKGWDIQACNNPQAWPFAELARRAAAERPDLIIHVGDYYYRESACPVLADAKCAGSPHGDAWPSWEADFFGPARPLLQAAPWVFARGNHESCARGGLGWFRLLDAAEHPLACPAPSAAFTVPLGVVRLYVLDSADAEDRRAPAEAVAAVSRQLDQLAPSLAKGEGWIVTHRPIWGRSARSTCRSTRPNKPLCGGATSRACR